jgi:hypothetical protein
VSGLLDFWMAIQAEAQRQILAATGLRLQVGGVAEDYYHNNQEADILAGLPGQRPIGFRQTRGLQKQSNFKRGANDRKNGGQVGFQPPHRLFSASP